MAWASAGGGGDWVLRGVSFALEAGGALAVLHGLPEAARLCGAPLRLPGGLRSACRGLSPDRHDEGPRRGPSVQARPEAAAPTR